ncbi:MAG: hypothetical protein J6J12_02475 [Oscillospiraceae bacterium]|nr:hypothetical protein [Oscillospiraceae bacterium]
MSAQQHRTVLLMIFGFSVWTTFCFSDPMNLLAGYSVFWILLLYIVGALVKAIGLDKRISQRCAILGYMICAILAYGSKMCEVLLDGRLTRLTQGTGFLMSYTSPAVLLCAVFLLIFFCQMQNVPKRLIPGIRWMSSVSFGVFLIHTQIIIRTRFYKNAFVWITTLDVSVFFLVVIVSSIVVYCLCGSLEYLRQWIFVRMGINRRVEILYKAVKSRILQWMENFGESNI